MAKTKEELDALKEEVESVNEKLQELSAEELEQVNGGTKNLAILYGTQIGMLAGSTCQAELLGK